MDQNFWEVAIAPDASWSWRKILQIRDIIGNHFIHVIQNGRNTSAWTDIWASHSRLKDMLSRREIVRAGFSGREKVCDLYQNGSWVWLSAWVEVIPSLATVSHPNPQAGNDVVKWRMIDGKVAEFSVNVVWHTIRPHADQVLWVNLVWFSQCVPRHAFMVWLLMGERLKTQDKLKIWERKFNSNSSITCSLCKQQEDSHTHLFFSCSYSARICRKGAQIVGMPNWGLDWKAITDVLIPLASRNLARIIVTKIVFGAMVYYIWQERNSRLFGKAPRFTTATAIPQI
ncbi:uncharacterized protein [Rutidosis leptorrhynchoides]|uniref:uncharacterized protein n=1 Tax=Rutidosis leptorrhynchoides TaxID=125765 RepID=UPI003A994E65